MSDPANAAATPVTPAPRAPFPFMVLAWGIATSVLTLFGVHWLNSSGDFHIMGWYADYVLPVGAIIVGVAASSGYGLASWFSGIRITKRLLWVVLAMQVVVYFAAEYIEFRHMHLIHKDGTPVGFFEYYDIVARSFAWKKQHGDGAGEPLGAWGYLFRGLEVLGFAVGGLFVPAILMKTPYCAGCQRYMKTRLLGTVAASVPLKKLKKNDSEGSDAHRAEQEEAFARGKRITEIARGLAAEGRTGEFKQTLAEVKAVQKKVLRLPARFQLHLISCRKCQSGWLRLNLVQGQGRHVSSAEVARQDLQPDFVQGLEK